jgi:hypothetical protein
MAAAWRCHTTQLPNTPGYPDSKSPKGTNDTRFQPPVDPYPHHSRYDHPQGDRDTGRGPAISSRPRRPIIARRLHRSLPNRVNKTMPDFGRNSLNKKTLRNEMLLIRKVHTQRASFLQRLSIYPNLPGRSTLGQPYNLDLLANLKRGTNGLMTTLTGVHTLQFCAFRLHSELCELHNPTYLGKWFPTGYRVRQHKGAWRYRSGANSGGRLDAGGDETDEGDPTTRCSRRRKLLPHPASDIVQNR